MDVPAQRRARLVGLVHDNQGPVDMHQVDEAEADAARGLPVLDALQAGQVRRDRREVRLEHFVMVVDPAPFPERLDRADDDAEARPEIMRRDLGEVADVEDPDAAAEGLVEDLPVGMANFAQRIGRLRPDRVCRHQPQDHRKFPLHPGVPRHGDRVRCEDRLAASGGQTQADAWHVGQRVERLVARCEAAQAGGLFRLSRDRGVGLGRAGDPCLLQEPAQSAERVLLVGLQLHRRAFTSYGVCRNSTRSALSVASVRTVRSP